jgi:ferritin-like metal-binding protein YciE
VQLDSLQELYVDELKDLYNAEQQILKALPQMVKAASHRELKRALTEHERVTRRQVKRLERIFRDLGEKPTGKKCVGMEGIIDEGKELIKEKPEAEVLDAGLIAKAQHVEHYEMAGYGTVRTYAQQLGFEEHARLLQETLDEEGEADKRLSALAVSSINIEAEEPDDEEMTTTTRRSTGSTGRGARGGSRGGRSTRGTGTTRRRTTARA